MLSDLTLTHNANSNPTAFVKAISGVNVDRDLTIRLISKPDDQAKGRAVLNAIEVREQTAIAAK